MNKFSHIGLSIITAAALTLVGCGGGGGSNVPPTQNNANGLGNKGPFKKGSTVYAYQLDDNGNRIPGKESNTTTIDDKGTYSLSPSWSGITEVRIVGSYLNEATGKYMTDGNISAIVYVNGSTSAGINILTDMAAAIIKQKLNSGEITTSGKTFAEIKQEAQKIVQKQFNLDLSGGTKLEDLDVTSDKNKANSQLLKVSAALMKTPNPKKALEALKDDIKDGKVDDAGLGAVKEIKEQAKTINPEKIQQNIEENVADAKAPVEEQDGTLSLDSTITFGDISDAIPNTEYKVKSTIDGVIGDSALISADGATFTVNGQSGKSEVANGDVVEVAITSSKDYNSTKTVNVTIGGTLFPITVATKVAPRAKDRTPDDFDLGFKIVDSGTTNVTSDEVTISGIEEDNATTISIKDGVYSINGGAFTSQEGNISDGDKVKVRLDSADTFGTATKATLTIGTVSKKFVVVTKEADTNPDANVSFTPKYDVDANATNPVLVESNEITITGINTAIPISIKDGKYSINGAGYTDVDGNVNNGDKVKVQLTASSKYQDKKTAILYIGDMEVPFVVITKEDPFVPDTTPVPFKLGKVFVNEKDKNIEVNTTVAGINTEAPISISGGKYKINGGEATDEAGKVNPDDNVTVVVTSGDYGETKKATLTIGGVSSTFTVVTRDDKTPDPVVFEPKFDQNISTEIESNEVTISGLSHPVPTSIDGDSSASFTINGANASNGEEVKNGDKVKVKLTTSAEPSTMSIATLTVGDSKFKFIAKTKAPEPKFDENTKTQEINEDSTFSYSPVIKEGEVDKWKVEGTLPEWLSFDKRIGKFYGKPTNIDANKDYNFTIIAHNASGDSNQTLNIHVNNVNDAPVIHDLNSTLQLKVGESESVVLDINATDDDVIFGDNIDLNVEPKDDALFSADLNNSKLTVALKTSAITGHASIPKTITVTATDSEGAKDEKKIKLTIVPLNNPPHFSDSNPPSFPQTIQEDQTTPIIIPLNAEDADKDPITYKVESLDPTRATGTIVGNKLKINLIKDANGEARFKVTPNDGIEDGTPKIIQIVISAVNDAPVLQPISHPAIDEDSSTIAIDLNATDVDNETLTYVIDSHSSNVDANISDSTLLVTPKPNANGTATVKVKAYDGELYSEPQTLSLVINPINDAPVALNDSDSTDNKHDITIDVLANDTDVDGDTLTIKSITQPNSGTASIVGNKILFHPNSSDTNATATFTYTVTDGIADVDANVTVSIGEYKSALAKVADDLDDFDPETGDVDAKLSEIRSKLNNANSDDKEAKIGLAILDLADILNSSEVRSLINVKVDGSEPSDYLPAIIKSVSSENSDLTVELLDQINDLSGISTDILHNMSEKLVAIVGSIDDVYTDANTTIKLGNEEINKTQADLVSVYALIAASNLEFLASYHYVDYDDVKTRTATINGKTYEYQNIAINPAPVLNKTNTLTISNSTRLSNAKALLVQALDRLLAIDTSKISDSDEKKEVEDNREKLIDIRDSLKNNTSWIQIDEDDNITVKKYVKLSAIYNPSTAITTATFGSNFTYTYKGESAIWDETQSKIAGEPRDAQGHPLEIEPQTAPTAATSSIDDILTEIKVTRDGQTSTFMGDDIFGYFNDINIHITQGANGPVFTIEDADENDANLYKWELISGTEGISLANTTGTTNSLNLNGATGNIWYNIKVTDKYGHINRFGSSFYYEANGEESSNNNSPSPDTNNNDDMTPPSTPNI